MVKKRTRKKETRAQREFQESLTRKSKPQLDEEEEDPDEVLGLNDAGSEAASDEDDGVDQGVYDIDDDGDDDAEEEAEEDEAAGKDSGPDGADEGDDGATKGWRKQEFYGGSDSDSDAGSDAAMLLDEARKLEERRLRRIRGEADALGSLLATAVPQTEESAEDAKVEGGVDFSVEGTATAKFESVFTEKAEHATVTRDVSALSTEKRRSIMKKEAPELAPLLEDFRAKLDSMRQVAPLVQSDGVQSSGKAYLDVKAQLLLNTLANLSYYVLLRAEGGTVRAHPVISQLVWLRELSEELKGLDEHLDPQIKKALKAAKRAAKAGNGPAPANGAAAPAQEGPALPAPTQRKPRRTLRERLEGLQAAATKATATPQASGQGVDAVASRNAAALSVDTNDLLRLPGKARRKSQHKGAGLGEAPEDLQDVDPILGAWRPSTSVSAELNSVQQLLGQQVAKARPVSAEVDVEPHQRHARAKAVEDPDEFMAGGLGPIGAGDAGEAPSDADDQGPSGDDGPGGEDADVDEFIRQVAQKKQSKKDREAKRAAAAAEATAERHRRPEKSTEGRRDTSKKILENKGLVRHRQKYAGNARKSNRIKYEKAVKRRKGAVVEMREGAADGTYDGEGPGIRTHVRKSLKLS